MTPPRYLFIDDATGAGGDAEHYRNLLNKADQLQVELTRPDRDTLLVPEAELADNIDGFILDINLSDQTDDDGIRFLGTGAGLAQDLRLLQALGPGNERGQRPRPVVRLCAAQVFQDYLAGDNSTADIFDLGFDKETIGDFAEAAREKLAVLPSIYADIEAAQANAADAGHLLGLPADQYASLHSRFRGALEAELERKTHEAVSFLLRQFIDPPGLVINEELLAIRLGIDRIQSEGWGKVRDHFAPARYTGTGGAVFSRWWTSIIMTQWAEISTIPLFKLSAEQRVAAQKEKGFTDLAPLVSDARSPGEFMWLLSTSPDPDLRLPVDPRFGFSVNNPLAPWLDEVVWCLEMAKRNRNSPMLSEDARLRLKAALSNAPHEGAG